MNLVFEEVKKKYQPAGLVSFGNWSKGRFKEGRDCCEGRENSLEGISRLVCAGIQMRLGTKKGASDGLPCIGPGPQLVLVFLCPCARRDVNSSALLLYLSLAVAMI